MPINITCACSAVVTVSDDQAGRETACPVCGSAVVIPPTQKAVFGFLDDDTSPEFRAAAIRQKNEKRKLAKQLKKRPAKTDNDEDEEALAARMSKQLLIDAAASKSTAPPLPPMIFLGIGSLLLGVVWLGVFYYLSGMFSIVGGLIVFSGISEVVGGILQLRQWGEDYGDS